MNKDILKKAAVGMAIGFALLPFLALAVEPVSTTPVVTGPDQFTTILEKVLTWVGTIVFIIAMIMLLYAAILYVTAGASETAHSKAKTVLIYAVVGIVIALLSYSVKPFLETILGWGGAA